MLCPLKPDEKPNVIVAWILTARVYLCLNLVVPEISVCLPASLPWGVCTVLAGPKGAKGPHGAASFHPPLPGAAPSATNQNRGTSHCLFRLGGDGYKPSFVAALGFFCSLFNRCPLNIFGVTSKYPGMMVCSRDFLIRGTAAFGAICSLGCSGFFFWTVTIPSFSGCFNEPFKWLFPPLQYHASIPGVGWLYGMLIVHLIRAEIIQQVMQWKYRNGEYCLVLLKENISQIKPDFLKRMFSPSLF